MLKYLAPSEISSSRSQVYPDSAFLPFSGNSRRRERDTNVIRRSNSNDKSSKRIGSSTSSVATTSIRKPTPVLRPNSGPITRVASWNMDDSVGSMSSSNLRSRQKSAQSYDEGNHNSIRHFKCFTNYNLLTK